jgi:hypothetical protein
VAVETGRFSRELRWRAAQAHDLEPVSVRSKPSKLAEKYSVDEVLSDRGICTISAGKAGILRRTENFTGSAG